MFKFIHAADIHLDSPFLGLVRYEGAPVDRITGATREALTQLVQSAIHEKVSFVIIAGDLFDGDWKDYNTGLFFRRQMTLLQDAGIRVFLISGNHDAASQITKNLRMPGNIHTFSTRKPGTVMLPELNTAIHGQGFSRRDITDNLAVHYPDARKGFYNIGILHTCAQGIEGHEPYAPCKVEELSTKGYDYWALGHIHKRRILSESPWIVFPGNIQGRNIRETGEKGCSLVTVEDDGKTSVRHDSLDIMRWVYLEIECSGAQSIDDVLENVYASVGHEVTKADGRLLAIRLCLSGACKAHEGLLSHQERWNNEIRATVTEASGGDAWIEKILYHTRTHINIDKLKASNSPIGHMMRYIDEIESDTALLTELAQELETLKLKLPVELRQGERALDLQSREKIASLVHNARQLLIPRILALGEDR
ncbi:MAG: metallophosphoesterase family protein [bacterium]